MATSKKFMLPCTKTLQIQKNRVQQHVGIVHDNLLWMVNEARRRNLTGNKLKGGILLDEMSIQDDLQIVRKSTSWKLIGAIDLGQFVNNLDLIMNKRNPMKLATHILQYMFVSYGGFRWPVAYYGTNNASGHQLYYTFWNLVKELFEYGFEVEYCMMDGAVMNRNFVRMMFAGDPAVHNFKATNPYYRQQKMPLVQDIKHCIKKIRNGLLSSSCEYGRRRCLMLDNMPITWDMFIRTYEFNNTYCLRPDLHLTKMHVYPSNTDKMRNHLAEEVLNKDFLELMSKYQATIDKPSSLESCLKLLSQTASIIEIFDNIHCPVESFTDERVKKIIHAIEFFRSWENQFTTSKDKDKYLMSRETREDIICSLIGFLEVLKLALANDIAIIPGYFNSDLIENWFCQLRGMRQGMSTNMTLSQIGPAINANLLTGNVVSYKSKSNVGKQDRAYDAAEPMPKKVKNSLT